MIVERRLRTHTARRIAQGKVTGLRFARVLGGIVALFMALPVFAQDVVGTVVSVSGRAELSRDNDRFRLAPEVSILTGDTILTGSDGTVELLFRDDTRIAIGPRSQFVAADIQMRRSGRANRFTVATVGGAFRFLSGNSARGVYDIRTPTATLGIRGTQFDVALDRSRDTTLVTFLGEVQFCGAGQRCFAVSGSCATVRAGSGGVIPRAVEGDAQRALLQSQFPFIRSQNALRSDFRTSLAGCDDDDDASRRAARPVEIRELAVSSTSAPASASNDGDTDDDADPDPGGDADEDSSPRSGG